MALSIAQDRQRGMRGAHQQFFAGDRSSLVLYQSRWSKIVHIYSYFRGMAKKRRSANQREKRRQQSRERNERFLIKKDNERSAKDMAARQAALDKLGIKLEFGFDDHRGAYSFADHRAPLNQPPIKTIDVSVPPHAVTAHRHTLSTPGQSFRRRPPLTSRSTSRFANQRLIAPPGVMRPVRGARRPFCRCM